MSAQVVTRVRIQCDKMTGLGPCRAACDWPASDVETARGLASRAGWSHLGGSDRCPAHTPARAH